MKTISTNQAKVHFDYYVHMTIMELGSINDTKILMQNVGGTNKECYGIFDSG